MGKQGNGGEGLSESENAKEKGGRDELGRFLPGHSIKSPGRPPKEWSHQNMAALMRAFTPEEKTEYLRIAMRLAHEQNSARGIVAVMEYIDDRIEGRPTQRVVTEQGGLIDVLDQLKGDE